MEDQNELIADLEKRIERLTEQHQFFSQEIQQVQKILADLKSASFTSIPSKVANVLHKENKDLSIKPVPSTPAIVVPPKNRPPQSIIPNTLKAPLEEFIGTNLLNKVGIAVLVIGIGFGTKYAIDHDLLSPLTRIILAYLSGIVIIGFAIKLKKKYESFSAVLLSGGIAALYFVTYAAYAFYDLIPQLIAFALMAIFTLFTAFAAIQYNMEVIAIIGFVGAYAIPFLLSDGSGRVTILFSYMSIINGGILILAFKKYWKRLYYLAFALTWIIFGSWYTLNYNYNTHFWISLLSSSVFFLLFYVTFLSYKILQKEPLNKWDVFFVLFNSFLYFSYGYLTIDSRLEGEQFLGVFTLYTACIHFAASVILYKKQKNVSKDIFYLIAGLVLVFITLAIPIQLEGSWVTLVWSAEASLLFWIGRTKKYPVYEKLSYVLIILAVFSLMQDWDSFYQMNWNTDIEKTTRIIPFINIQFFASLWVILSLAFILKISFNERFVPPLQPSGALHKIVTYALPSLVGIVTYFAIFKEIQAYWDQRYLFSYILVKNSGGDYSIYDDDLRKFQTLWLTNYSAIFGLVLTIINLRFIKNKVLSYVSAIFNALVVTTFLTSGLVELSKLRLSYLEQVQAEYYFRGIYHILIRYISIVFILPLIICNYWYIWKTEDFEQVLQKIERVLFHLVVLTLLSSELIHWLNMAQVHNSFKLALSILWGSYALLLIVIGLWRNQKHIRLTGIILFGITLLKLFIYDMVDMSTISKTIVMMILGVLLLTASFLYNKYKRTHEIS